MLTFGEIPMSGEVRGGQVGKTKKTRAQSPEVWPLNLNLSQGSFFRYFRYFNLNLSQGSFSNILGGQRPPYPHKHGPAQSGECPVTHVKRASTGQFRDSLEGDLKNKIFDLF